MPIYSNTHTSAIRGIAERCGVPAAGITIPVRIQPFAVPFRAATGQKFHLCPSRGSKFSTIAFKARLFVDAHAVVDLRADRVIGRQGIGHNIGAVVVDTVGQGGGLDHLILRAIAFDQGGVTFDVLMPGGEMIADAANLQLWAGCLPVGGDYSIDVKSGQFSEFTLQIEASAAVPTE